MRTRVIRQQLLKQLNHVRYGKVKRLRSLLKHGHYHVDTKKVAAALAGV